MPLSFQDLQGGGNGPVVAAGVAGGLSGVAEAWQENHAEKIREMLARIAAGEKVQSATIRGKSAENVAGIRNTGQLAVQGARNQGAQTVQELRNTGNENVANIHGDTARDVANTRGEAAQNVAGTRLEGTKYAADQGFAGRKLTAEDALLGRKYAADRGYQGRVYSADRGYQGRTYGADRSLQGAEVRAGATRYGADRRADSLYPPSVFGQPGQPPNTGQTPITLPRVSFGQNAVSPGGGSPDQPLPPAGGPMPPAGVGQTPITPTRPRAAAGGGSGTVDQAALETAATAALKSLGKSTDPTHVQLFIQKNHDALVQQLQGAKPSSGGGSDNEL